MQPHHVDLVPPATPQGGAAPANYRADIDGLRAVAVLSVVFYHAGLPTFGGGFVGVDVFFVISGYLITSIIWGQLGRGSFSIGGFYERRIRRIFPALFAVVLATVATGWLWMMPFDLQGFGSSLAAMAGFSSNFFFCKTGYFDGGANIEPLLHTWSLSVEEQFYIVFPVLLALLARRGATTVRAVIVLLLVGSLVANVFGVRSNTAWAFYMPWQRAWELLAGSVLALGYLPSIASRRWCEILGVVGLAAIAVAVFGFDEHTRFPGEAALLPVVGTVLLIHTGSGAPTRVAVLLGMRAPVFIGLVSYSLYLWHWPIFVFARYRLMRDLTSSEALALGAVALLAAVASWRWVERPFRHVAAQDRGRVKVFIVALVLLAVTALVGGGLYFTRGVPMRLAPDVRAAAMAAYDVNPDSDLCHNHKPEQLDADDVCQIGDGQAPSFVVLGDSYADALVPGLAAAARSAGRSGFVITKGGCAPLPELGNPGCQAFSAATMGFLGRHPEIDTVVMAARWSGFTEGSRFGENRPKVTLSDALSETPGPADNRRVLARGFERGLEALAPRRVVVIGFVPEQRVRPPRVIALVRRHGLDHEVGVDRATYDQRQAHAHAIIDPLAQRTGVSVIDLGPALCDAAGCPGERDGMILYSDDNHLSLSGALALEQALAPSFVP